MISYDLYEPTICRLGVLVGPVGIGEICLGSDGNDPPAATASCGYGSIRSGLDCFRLLGIAST